MLPVSRLVNSLFRKLRKITNVMHCSCGLSLTLSSPSSLSTSINFESKFYDKNLSSLSFFETNISTSKQGKTRLNAESMKFPAFLDPSTEPANMQVKGNKLRFRRAGVWDYRVLIPKVNLTNKQDIWCLLHKVRFRGVYESINNNVMFARVNRNLYLALLDLFEREIELNLKSRECKKTKCSGRSTQCKTKFC